MDNTSHVFSLEDHYMFFFAHAHGTCSPGVIVEKPTSIDKDKILFHFLVGYKSEGEYIEKDKILAVGDQKNGTVEVIGWSGKYRILNNELFNAYVEKKVLELKS